MLAKELKLVLLVPILASCVTADLGVISKNASSVLTGDTSSQIVEKMGTPPKARIENPNNPQITYLHFCEFGFATDDNNGFFLYRDQAYFRAQANYDSRTVHGVYGVRGDTSFNCASPVRVDWAYAPIPPAITERRAKVKVKNYTIDKVRISVTEDQGAGCQAGGHFTITLDGEISADTSFAMDKILSDAESCRNSLGSITHRTTVDLRSPGGLLEHGYKLGELFRRSRVRTKVGAGNICASSCALAFLGGVDRVVEPRALLLFHAPYSVESLGRKRPDCSSSDQERSKLLGYYQRMVSVAAGLRLFDRTLSYCDADDGWIIEGPNAAELFEISTEQLSEFPTI